MHDPATTLSAPGYVDRGDLRVAPKSPEDLKLPTAAYLRGADCFYSFSSWGPEATKTT